MPLNPSAPAFVPSSIALKDKTRNSYTASGPQAPTPYTGPSLADVLPRELLVRILSAALEGVAAAADVVRLASVCEDFRSIILDLTTHVQLPRGAGHASALLRARHAITSLRRCSPGLVLLDVNGLPVEDDDVAALLRSFPALRVLLLSGCQKLSPRIGINGLCEDSPDNQGRHIDCHVEVDSRTNDTTCGTYHQLQVLDLSRCFQMKPQQLTDMLLAAQGTSLHAVALSHLPLAEWPPGCATHRILRSVCFAGNSGLRVLALTNCIRLTSAGLWVILNECSRLQLLMLGGCTVGTCTAAPLVPPRLRRMSQSSAAEPGEARTVHQAAAAAVAAIAAAAPDSELARVDATRDFTVQLATMAAMHPALVALELTFFPPGVVDAVRATVAQVRRSTPRLLPERPLVWDFCEPRSLAEVLDLLHGRIQLPHIPDTWQPGGMEEHAAMKLALQAATSCSSQSRRTPLHIAAEQGLLGVAQDLLHLGAVVEARDRGGGTPLFRACFFGHEDLVQLLLDAGTDARKSNTAFETPIYIAALRGHVCVVDLLLAHYASKSYRWQDPSLYEAGWTPLMAAAVADRVEVARRLLQAAGPGGPALVAAANKYGQTAMHVAARRGCLAMVRQLLSALGSGGPRSMAALNKKDASGDTVKIVAKKYKHGDVEAEVLQHLQRLMSCDRQLGH